MDNQKKVWDALADKWSEYREKPIPEVIEFLKKHDKPNGKMLDLGCGSGRNFCRLDSKIFAVDFSEKMLRHAKEKAEKIGVDCECLAVGCDSLPFKDNFFDAAIFISSLHCLDSELKRKKAIGELFRVLKSRAEAMISVWDKKSLKKLDENKEAFVSWKHDDVEYERYYYFFDKDELKILLEEAGFEIINSKSFISEEQHSKKNIVIIARKP